MKIWLPINVSATGGSSSFAAKFKQGMEQRGHAVMTGLIPPTQYDGMVVSPRAPLGLVYQARQQRKFIIHRLDGAYYPATPVGWLFPAYNAPLTLIQCLSHHTVYQSQYAQAICQRLVGPRATTKTSIIYNGVDTNQFSPPGERHPLRAAPDQPIFFTAQQFRRRDQLEPLVAALTVYQQRHAANAKLVIAGDFVGEAATLVPHLKKNSSLQLLGPISNSELPNYLRGSDTFLYCHPNPACPNNVLEAMACGVPILGIRDGAMPEIVRDGQDGYLVSLPGNGHLVSRSFNASAFADAMHHALTNKETLGHNARTNALANFTLDRMIDEYGRVITNISGR